MSCHRRRRNRLADAGVTDVIGNVLLVALTVALTVSAGLLIVFVNDPGEKLNAEFTVDSTPTSLRVIHMQGEPVPLGNGYVTLNVDGTEQSIPLANCKVLEERGDPDHLEHGETLLITDPEGGCADFEGQTLTELRLILQASEGGDAILFSTWTGQVQGNDDPSG